MISVAVKADAKTTRNKNTCRLSYNFLQEIWYIQNLKLQNKHVFFIQFWLLFHSARYYPLGRGVFT